MTRSHDIIMKIIKRPTMLKIILILDRPKTLNQIAREANSNKPRVKKYLAELNAMGLVEVEEGSLRLYKLTELGHELRKRMQL